MQTPESPDPNRPFYELSPEKQNEVLNEVFDIDAIMRYVDGDIEETLRVLESLPRAIDLRTIPRADWENYVSFDLVMPAKLHEFIDGQKEITTAVCDYVENALTAHYLVFPPFCIYFDGITRTAQLLEL